MIQIGKQPSTRKENACGPVYRARCPFVKLHCSCRQPQWPTATDPGPGDQCQSLGQFPEDNPQTPTSVSGGRNTCQLALRGAVSTRSGDRGCQRRRREETRPEGRQAGCLCSGRGTPHWSDQDTGLQRTRGVRTTSGAKSGLYDGGRRFGPCTESDQEPLPFAGDSHGGQGSLLTGCAGEVAEEGACECAPTGRNPLPGTRCNPRSAEAGGERALGRGPQAPDLPHPEELPRYGTDPCCADAADRGHALSILEQALLLELRRNGDRHAQFFGLGESGRRQMAAGGGATDAGIEPKLQPHTEADLQRCSYYGDPTSAARRAPLSALSATARWWYQTESGQAYRCPPDCIDYSVDVAIRGGLRPSQIEDDIADSRIGEIADEGLRCLWREIRRRDGIGGEHPLKSWSGTMCPESPQTGYAPPESRTKQWAQESPIEGWFPYQSGELSGCDVTADARGERTSYRHRLKCFGDDPQSPCLLLHRERVGHLGRTARADAGCKTESIRWMRRVCLDILPYRRISEDPQPPPLLTDIA